MNSNPLSQCKVLVVDDDILFVEIIEHYLSEKDVTIDSAGDIESACKKINKDSYDLVLLDGFLPDGKGIELMPFIKDNNIDTPVIMVTADDDQNSMEKCFLEGIRDYVIKPVNMGLLWLKMQRCFKVFLLEQQMQLQNEQLERYLDEKNQEEELARHVYRHLAESTTGVTDGIDCHMQASQVFNGDFFIAGKSPNGNDLMMLVDATGHGLAAAISVLQMVSTIRTMVQKGLGLAHIVHEINDKLYREIPDDRFVAGIGIEVDHQRTAVNIFNAGMPDALLLDGDCNITLRIKSESLPLGIVDEEAFSPAIKTIPLTPDIHVIFYSDGLLEQTSLLYESFGNQGLQDVIDACQDPNTILENIVTAFSKHSVNSSVEDDVSICAVNLWKVHQSRERELDDAESKNEGCLTIKLTLNGAMLQEANSVSLLDEALRNISVKAPLRQKAFTVFSELMNNAIDHGILGLKSELKNDFEGFAEYLEERESRLAQLKLDDRVDLELVYDQATEELTFSVLDSGEGYTPDPQKYASQDNLSGRGVKLVEALCESTSVVQPGNQTSVVLK